MPDEKTIQQLEYMEGVARRCIQAVHYFHLTTGHPGEFWPFVQNVVGESVCLFWAHLFGNRSDDLHYSKLFSRKDLLSNAKDYKTENIKKRLLAHVGLSDEKFEAFWEEVKTCRDQFVAHRDLSKSKIIFPHIDVCRKMAEELRVIFSELIAIFYKNEPDNIKLEGLKKYYEFYPNEMLEKKCQRAFKQGIKSVNLEQ